MKKFEYTTESNVSPERLNELGSKGWELITVINLVKVVYYFKREVVQSNSEKSSLKMF